MSTAIKYIISFRLKVHRNSRVKQKDFFIKLNEKKKIKFCNYIINLFQPYKMTSFR